MEVTRRDALAALATLGVGSAVAGEVREPDGDLQDVIPTVAAVASVVYPSAVDVTDEYVRNYVAGRTQLQDNYERQVVDLCSVLDANARDRYGSAFRSLPIRRRETVLREMGIDRAKSAPDGTVEQQFRYYVVNDLLYALYTTPVGGRLLGIENPPGHPGGTEAYQRRGER
jgi:hypothetical protein